MDQMLSRLYLAKPKATATATIELPEGHELPPDAAERVRAATRRYCRRKIALIDDEIENTRRFGYRSLFWGFVALVILNGLAQAIDDDWDPIASGLSVASWVILWVPVNLLIYDLFFLRRDRRAYRALLDAPVTVIRSGGSASGGSAPP